MATVTVPVDELGRLAQLASKQYEAEVEAMGKISRKSMREAEDRVHFLLNCSQAVPSSTADLRTKPRMPSWDQPLLEAPRSPHQTTTTANASNTSNRAAGSIGTNRPGCVPLRTLREDVSTHPGLATRTRVPGTSVTTTVSKKHRNAANPSQPHCPMTASWALLNKFLRDPAASALSVQEQQQWLDQAAAAHDQGDLGEPWDTADPLMLTAWVPLLAATGEEKGSEGGDGSNRYRTDTRDPRSIMTVGWLSTNRLYRRPIFKNMLRDVVGWVFVELRLFSSEPQFRQLSPSRRLGAYHATAFGSALRMGHIRLLETLSLLPGVYPCMTPGGLQRLCLAADDEEDSDINIPALLGYRDRRPADEHAKLLLEASVLPFNQAATRLARGTALQFHAAGGGGGGAEEDVGDAEGGRRTVLHYAVLNGAHSLIQAAFRRHPRSICLFVRIGVAVGRLADGWKAIDNCYRMT